MILAIEASVGGGSLSLISGGKKVAGWEGDAYVSRAEDVLPAVAQLMSAVQLSRPDLTGVAVSCGPGSFTGIRIGLSTALGLSAGLRIRLTSVSILTAMAAAANQGKALVAVPMGRASICVQWFEGGCSVTEPATVSESEFTSLARSSDNAVIIPHVLVGYVDKDEAVTDLGINLSEYIGAFAATHPDHSDSPMFVSKSF